MGSSASVEFATVEEALAGGTSQEAIDAYLAAAAAAAAAAASAADSSIVEDAAASLGGASSSQIRQEGRGVKQFRADGGRRRQEIWNVIASNASFRCWMSGEVC